MDNKVYRCPHCGKSWSDKSLHGLGGYPAGTILSTCNNCMDNPPEAKPEDFQIKDEEKHVRDIQEDLILSKINTKEDLIKFLFDREFEPQVHNEEGARRERLEAIMDKMMELWPEIDWKSGVVEKEKQDHETKG